MGIIRTTFIIDEQGKIEDIIEKVKTKEHSLQILQWNYLYPKSLNFLIFSATALGKSFSHPDLFFLMLSRTLCE